MEELVYHSARHGALDLSLRFQLPKATGLVPLGGVKVVIVVVGFTITVVRLPALCHGCSDTRLE